MDLSAASLEDLNQGYFTGLCTVFVATIQETKDRIFQLETVFCNELFQTFQNELAKSRNVCKRLEKVQHDAELLWNQERENLFVQLENVQSENRELEERYHQLKEQNDDLISNFALEKEEIIRSHKLEKEKLMSNLQNVAKSLQSNEVESERIKAERLIQQVSKMEEDLKNNHLKIELLKSELEQEKSSRQEAINQFRNLKKMYKSLRAQYDVLISLSAAGADKASAHEKRSQNARQGDADSLKQRSLHDYSMAIQSTTDGRAYITEAHNNKTTVSKDGDVELKENEHQVASESQEKFESVNASISNIDRLGVKSNLHNVYGKMMMLRSTPFEDQETEEQQVTQHGVDRTERRGHPREGKDQLEEENNKKIEDWTKELKAEQIKEVINPGFRETKNGKGSLTMSSIPRPRLVKRSLETKLVFGELQRRNLAWRDTRLHQGSGPRVDPHDDFLDTPIDNVLHALKKEQEEGCYNQSDPKDSKTQNILASDKLPSCDKSNQACIGLNFRLSTDEDDDETQPMDTDPVESKSSAKSTRSSSLTVEKGLVADERTLHVSRRSEDRATDKNNNRFKFVEPVRKKADREALKGIQCNQCKKFYDAVKGANDGGDNAHCQHHHEEVSRHRYRYAPPATPEGFWNLGFDSDL